ncbi:MAG: hypothetical protein EBR00_02920 [Gammaproteobacteria bacterium]|nr:hypothetical protein [Gammaproteobacteria bacterium]
MLETVALTMSTSRSAIMVKLKTAVANVSVAKTAPNAEPTAKNFTKERRSFGSMRMKALTIMPARD